MRDLMNSHSKNLQEMVAHLCRQLREAFGAAYCRIAFLPETAKTAAQEAGDGTENTAPAADHEVTVIQLDGKSADLLALARHNGDVEAEANASHADTASSIAAACRMPKPILRFYLQQSSDNASSSAMAAFLDLAFTAPQHFSAAEITAMMLMLEMTKTVLIAAWTRQAQATAAEQVVGKLQTNLFALPFLEAKKQWIDAFEEEYLRQQLMKY